MALVLGATLATSALAHAATEELDLLREGVALRRAGRDEEALQRFQRAYEIDHGARALAQMGLAEQALGRWPIAYEHLTQALAAPKDPWVATNQAALRTSLNEVSQHVGMLEFIGGSAGAEVRIDGVARGQLPLEKPLVLPIGSVTITIARAGFVPVQRVAIIRAHQMTRESFEPLAPSPEAGPAAHAVAAEVPGPPRSETRAAESAEHTGPVLVAGAPGEGISPARASAKWIAWGAAVAAVGVGVLGYAQQSSAGSQFNGSCFYDQTGTIRMKPGAQSSVDQCSSYSGSVNTWFNTEIAGFVGAGVLASLGVVFWLTEPTAASARATAFRCAPSATGRDTVSLGCRWQF